MLYAGFHSFPRALLGGDVPAAPIRRTWWRTSGPGGRATSGPPRCGSRWGNSVDLRACAADARPHRPVVPAGDSKAEFALLREARLAVIPSDWGTTPTAGTTAHLLTAVADDQGVEPALSVVMGDCPLPSCVTLVVRRLRTHAGHPKSCDHIS
jgi:hypothetical protein